ncbi:UDP-glucuronosyltransferase [Ceratitis capitata]|uniref:(Mediterranean fruit fly) hypothetical protein n=1 Tax=Ceratitis capitata TaxID=7213 RepID=A0A811UCZ5_CERCA|nr:UDP-glucuronosyltransferase [Ceratitis capitata]CAD6995926.1 unnamed protein product [Ceratitis capitata]
MARVSLVILALVCFAFVPSRVQAAKILVVFPFTGPSQYLLVQPYLKTLAARGHEITSVSVFPQKTPIKNFRDITLKIEEADHDEIVIAAIEEMSRGKMQQLNLVKEYVLPATLSVLTNEEFQQLLRGNEHFDLIIVEVFCQEALYALGSHFKAPMIGISTFGADVVNDQLVDNVSPVSYVSAPSGQYLDCVDFWQRLDNLYINTVEWLYDLFVILPAQQRLYETYFPNVTLDLSEVRRDFSLLLLNQHYSYSWPRPLVPNAIEIAGMHVEHIPKKLPADMEAFINASPKGAIYFSLGSNVKSAYLPKEKIKAIMDAFASLPVNVLWKFEKTDLPGKPKNVFINKWFPQQDILAHPKVKLFITHGGMHSTIEVVHHGKPIVGMPVFYDQHLNIQHILKKGFGVAVNFKNFTSGELRDAILEVLNNPKYAESAREISARFHDRPMKPLDAAIYWTEYVLRHKGAPQLRVAARHLNFLQRNSVDTMAVLFGIPILLVILIGCILYKLFKAIYRNANNTKTNLKKRKNE